MRRRSVILAVMLVLGLGGAGALAVWTTTGPGSQAPPSTSEPSSTRVPPTGESPRTPTMPPGPTVGTAPPSPPTPPAPVRPPRGSVQTPARYLTANHAARATWDDVLAAGRALPGVDASCARAWRSSGKDRSLAWSTADYRCLDRLPGTGFKPQGVAGSGTAAGYSIGGRAAAERNIVITSWYSTAPEKGLVVANRAGETVTRLVVMDLDRGRYNTVELVQTNGAYGFRPLDSHGSGLAWAGQYLYSSSRSALWMYNADDLLRIDGRFVLPAVAGWTVGGVGGLSSISVDRSTRPAQLTAINYAKDDEAHVQNFDLAPDGLLAPNSDRTRRGLSLHNRFGQHGTVVHSSDSALIGGASYQGVATTGAFSLANSSALRYRDNGPVDATVVLRDGKVRHRFRMPRGNVQSIYLDPRRGTYTTVTENFSRFLFTLPLRELTGD